MEREQLIDLAKQIVNSGVVQGFSGDILKQAANSDIKQFTQFLHNISDQAFNPLSAKLTYKAYGEQLVDICTTLFPNSLHEEKIKGGKADNLSIKDIAKKFKVSVESLNKELEIGKKVELEHTKNLKTAEDIAMDHLSEMPDYYSRLNKMEKSAINHWSGIKENKQLNESLNVVAYHGGDEKIEVFDPNIKPKNRVGNVSGFYFTQRLQKAQAHGQMITKANITLRNPFIIGKSMVNLSMVDKYKEELKIENPDLHYRWIDDKSEYFRVNKIIPYTGMDGNRQQLVYKAGGYDGVLDGDEICVFDNQSINIINENKKLIKKLLIETIDEAFKHNNQFLYHTTNMRNYDEIRSYGLLPQFGDTVKQAYGEYYDLDGTTNDDDDDYEDKPVKLDFDGLLFFSEYPMLGYSQTMQQNFKLNEALVCVVKKNNTIFHKVSDYPKFVDYRNNPVTSIDYNSVYDLPIIIETGDWFSFEAQSPVMLLEGRYIIEFMQKNFSNELKRYY